MGNATRVLNGNPLTAGSAQISGTSALSVTIEPDLTENEIAKPEDTKMTDPAKAGAIAGMITNKPPLLITDRHLQAGFGENIRVIVQETMMGTEEVYTSTLNMFDQASHALKAALDNVGANATKLSFKLMEFAQANVHNNIELANEYISVRSLPDALELQTAYFKRQFDLFMTQVGILQTLTTEIANENTVPFKTILSQAR